MQGNSQLMTEACASSSQAGSSSFAHQKNLSSVRSGQLVNYTNSINSSDPEHNTVKDLAS